MSMLGWWGDLSRERGQVSPRTPGKRDFLGKEIVGTVSREGTNEDKHLAHVPLPGLPWLSLSAHRMCL